MNDETLERIADSLERIAASLARQERHNRQPATTAPINFVLDGRAVARDVVRYTLARAARGPGGLVGGSLTADKKNKPRK